MKRAWQLDQFGQRFFINWSTLGGYLTELEHRGIAINVASFVSAGAVREIALGNVDIQPTPKQLEEMKQLVWEAMREGALGVTTALMYPGALKVEVQHYPSRVCT
jgi:N-acyl-D-amino-acid deacylase